MSDFLALVCPQCGGALPQQAAWRRVACPYCQALVTRNPKLVERSSFQAAMRRQAADHAQLNPEFTLAGAPCRLIAPLGSGETASVWLAERLAAYPERITLKIAHDKSCAAHLDDEYSRLQDLQHIDGPGSAYYSRRVPQPVAQGDYLGRRVLALRVPPGYWGSLAAVLHRQRDGIRAEHAVWIWRRVLDVLAYLHDKGLAHGALSADHWLVQPRDHGVMLTGWRRLHRAGADGAAGDLRQSAWTIRQLLNPSDDQRPTLRDTLPEPLATLLENTCKHDWCRTTSARELDAMLKSAARQSFGPPRFIHFHPSHY
ncbi:hypothetical protein [Chitinilyticum litopenaei]|uniref:hypothetical protein n=1 Tax=Chitinilyticum litopenaei TaxID=1121276 RepID=UPI0003F7F6D2|nr:hypothetical protein [Chitinilyticum litopenaei]